MKSLFVLLTLVFASVANAGPAVGNSATYLVTVNQGGTNISVTTTQEITAIDLSSQTATVQQTTAYNGTTISSQASQMNLSDILYLSDAEVAMFCAASATRGSTGVLETITVQAGTFSACHVKTADSTNGTSDVYIASVPFGVVKYLMTDMAGSVSSMELVSYKQ